MRPIVTTRTARRGRVALRLLAEMQKQTNLLREIRDLLQDQKPDDDMTVTLRLDEPTPLRRR